MEEATLQGLVAELLELNDDNLAKRVIETNDVQWCLSELYDILDADIQEVVRCKDCISYRLNTNSGKPLSYNCSIFGPYDFCSKGVRRTNNEN